jgi:hypothetical protein
MFTSQYWAVTTCGAHRAILFTPLLYRTGTWLGKKQWIRQMLKSLNTRLIFEGRVKFHANIKIYQTFTITGHFAPVLASF